MLARSTIAAGGALILALTLAGPGTALARPGQIDWREYTIVDQAQGGLVAARITAPAGWKLSSRVDWRYQDVSWPVRASARIESPDGSNWVEFFPAELYYWLEPARSPVANGARSLGMIHAPGITLQKAMQRELVGMHRGRAQNLKVVGARPVQGLAETFGMAGVSGEGGTLRIRYDSAAGPVDEDIYALLSVPNRIPYTGPQGTWYESHRALVLGHALGARNGQLDAVYPLLSFIARSVRPDPAWVAHRERVQAQISAEFNRWIQRGYAQIQAAAQLSRTISANNDAMLASMQAQRQAQVQADAARRAAAARASERSPNDEFSQYLRGTQRMKDPYRGESEQSYYQRYHWTDGHGNYRSSNDSGYNPNIGTGGGVTWQRMEPVR